MCCVEISQFIVFKFICYIVSVVGSFYCLYICYIFLKSVHLLSCLLFITWTSTMFKKKSQAWWHLHIISELGRWAPGLWETFERELERRVTTSSEATPKVVFWEGRGRRRRRGGEEGEGREEWKGEERRENVFNF